MSESNPHELCDAERHAAVDEAWHRGYTKGRDDESAAQEQARQYASERLAAVIEIVAHIEAHERVHTYARRVIARQLRDALALGDVRLKCSCDQHDEKGGA